MNGQQMVVGAAGAGLLAVNFWTGKQRTDLAGGIFNQKATGADESKAHTVLLQLGGEAIFLAAAAILAGTSSSWGMAMIAVIAALWILWSMHHYSSAGH